MTRPGCVTFPIDRVTERGRGPAFKSMLGSGGHHGDRRLNTDARARRGSPDADSLKNPAVPAKTSARISRGRTARLVQDSPLEFQCCCQHQSSKSSGVRRNK
ncbi:hypothetical protein CHARACLAT_002342 [Characodon lateralis]|uniref:Uncharacterized protein n=1 Tax=Characodon lateralis TaxID=208331 RepID=A0ABU7ERG7_9TELE|nr:hypothetical protein [Characodon lateralis]